MDTLPGKPIETVKEVVRQHVESVLARHPEVPRYRLALELGMSPSTLERRIREWGLESDEDQVRDRR